MKNIRNWYQLLEGTGLVAIDAGPGLAHGVLSANVTWCPFYSPPRSIINVAGTLDPDATGDYTYAGFCNSAPFFTIDSGFYLWWYPPDERWYLTQVLGTFGTRYWNSPSDPILGTYVPSEPEAGVPTVTCEYAIPYDQKGVIIGPSVSRIVTPAAAGFPAAAGSLEMLCRPAWSYNDGLAHFFWDTWGGANQRFLLYKSAAGTTTLYTGNTSRGSFTYTWSAAQLYHIVLNWGTNTLYVNGSLAHTFTAGGLGTGASTLYIGDHYSVPNYSFDGILYYFIARDLALTLAEIAQFKTFFENLYIPQLT